VRGAAKGIAVQDCHQQHRQQQAEHAAALPEGGQQPGQGHGGHQLQQPQRAPGLDLDQQQVMLHARAQPAGQQAQRAGQRHAPVKAGARAIGQAGRRQHQGEGHGGAAGPVGRMPGIPGHHRRHPAHLLQPGRIHLLQDAVEGGQVQRRGAGQHGGRAGQQRQGQAPAVPGQVERAGQGGAERHQRMQQEGLRQRDPAQRPLAAHGQAQRHHAQRFREQARGGERFAQREHGRRRPEVRRQRHHEGHAQPEVEAAQEEAQQAGGARQPQHAAGGLQQERGAVQAERLDAGRVQRAEQGEGILRAVQEVQVVAVILRVQQAQRLHGVQLGVAAHALPRVGQQPQRRQRQHQQRRAPVAAARRRGGRRRARRRRGRCCGGKAGKRHLLLLFVVFVVDIDVPQRRL
jgi:hypothetical protein